MFAPAARGDGNRFPFAWEPASFFEKFFADPASPSIFADRDFPLVNIHEEGNTYVVDAEMPGVAEEDIEITAKGQELEIRGEKRVEERSEEGRHRREIRTGKFYRAIRFPTEIDPAGTEAMLQKGVLTIRIPMRVGSEAKKVKVSVS